MPGTFGRSNGEKERRGLHFCKSHARKELKKPLEVLLGLRCGAGCHPPASAILQPPPSYSLRHPTASDIPQLPPSHSLCHPTASDILQPPPSYSGRHPTTSTILQPPPSYSLCLTPAPCACSKSGLTVETKHCFSLFRINI